MGQVPTQSASYLIIGSGRLARHLECYFKLENISYTTWNRRRQNIHELEFLSHDATHILLAIQDSAIPVFIQHHPFIVAKNLIHFSGAHEFAQAISAHPLCTFSETLYDLETYRKIPFVMTNPDLSFAGLFPQLKNPHFVIRAEQKARYHALCVMSGNFTNLLWNHFFQEMQSQFQIPQEYLNVYLQKTCDNLISHAPKSLTGPIVRKDDSTIKENLAALKGRPEYELYKAFLQVFYKEFAL